MTENIVSFPGLLGTTSKASTSIIIKVIDVDEPPRFSQKEYNITVDEEKYPIEFLGSVSAKDPDAINHPIRYILIHSTYKPQYCQYFYHFTFMYFASKLNCFHCKFLKTFFSVLTLLVWAVVFYVNVTFSAFQKPQFYLSK